MVDQRDNYCIPVENTYAGQLQGADTALKLVVKNFDLIIELGYHWGGLTLWFEKNKKKGTKVVGYDITDSYREVPDKRGVDYRIGDVFSLEIQDEIREMISKSNRALIFCDAEKGREFEIYSKIIRPNDVIMVHDYVDDNENKKEDYYSRITHSKKWFAGAEISLNAIKHLIESENLSGYYYDKFRNVIIGSFIKRGDDVGEEKD